MTKKSPCFAVVIFLLCLVSGGLAAAPAQPLIRLATTTSTENSGLLAYLLPHFEKQTGYKVHVIAVGTGKALRMGRDGDVDVLLVHAPAAEQRLIDEGFNEIRYRVMYNDFVLVGPRNDPAGLRNAETIIEALRRIDTSGALFISRGDDSGTHKKERGLWQAAGITPDIRAYRSAGQGMGKVLQISGELDAYTLTDRGTWIAYADKSPLTIVFERDPALNNPYSMIAISPERYPDTNFTGAMALVKWITSPTAQRLIGDFRIHGKTLFNPSADAAQ